VGSVGTPLPGTFVNHQIGIVAHVARQHQAEQLSADIAAEYVSVDDGSLGCELNHRKVWLWHIDNNRSEWAVNLEDDAVPVPDFRNQVDNALAAAPTPIVSLYLGRHHIPTIHWEQRKETALAQADNAGAHWITTNTLLHAVAVAIRTDILPTVIAHTMRLPDFMPNDEAISHFVMNNMGSIGYTIPSLCNHADQPTLFKHHDKLPRPPGRIAYRTGQREHWNSQVVTM